jgi:predicted DNA-binding transcriptional regulator YafY
MNNENDKSRRSQWRVIRRCTSILFLLLQDRQKSEKLLQIIYRDAGDENDSLSNESARRRFEEDRSRLKDWFGAELKYERSTDKYILEFLSIPLIDLPDEALKGLVFLEQTFKSESAPMHKPIREFLLKIKSFLPEERQKALKRYRSLLEVNLDVLDSDDIPAEVFDLIESACGQKRQLKFQYRSPLYENQQIHEHIVEPKQYYFENGHYYLYAYCTWSSFTVNLDQFVTYRLGRIRNPKILSQHFTDRNPPKYQLDYILSAKVARMGVTEHFANSQVVKQLDGSVLIHSVSTNLFIDIRKLLHYGENCHIVGGDEAIHEIKTIVRKLSQIYSDEK